MQPLEPFRYSNRYEDPGVGWFTVVLDADRVLFTTVDGKGTVVGTRALVAMYDEVSAMRVDGETVDAFMDLRAFSKTPLRAQAIMGKWLIKHRHQIDRIALVGAKPWERKIAQAVLKFARFDRAAFFETPEEAGTWLRPDRA